jgi:hypothetical protein
MAPAAAESRGSFTRRSWRRCLVTAIITGRRISRMPAYAKLKLVSSVFHPSDIAFARGWSRAARGMGGWTVLLDNDAAARQVSVIPPGLDRPVFFLSRQGGEVLVERRGSLGDDDEVIEAGRYAGLREAVLALCPLDDDALEEIQVALQGQFPRRDR